MDIAIKRVKSSPYKLVYTSDKVVGLFELGKFISARNFTEKHLSVIDGLIGAGEERDER